MPPHNIDPASPAVLFLAAEMINVPAARRWAFVRLFFTALAGAALDLTGPATSPTLGDLAIIRRDTGALLLRVDAADADLLAHVRQQLDELTVAEFLDRWGIEGSLDDDPRPAM